MAPDPNWAEILTAISTTIVALGVFVALVQVFDGRRTQGAEIIKELTRRWNSPEMVAARKRIASLDRESLRFSVQRAAEASNDRFYVYAVYLDFFEELGLICRHGAVRIRVVERALGTTVRGAWRKWKPIIRSVWEDQPQASENFGWLADKLEGRARRRAIRRRIWDRRHNLLPAEFGDDWISVE